MAKMTAYICAQRHSIKRGKATALALSLKTFPFPFNYALSRMIGRNRGVSASSRVSAFELDRIPHSNNDSAAALLHEINEERRQPRSLHSETNTVPPHTIHPTRSRNVASILGFGAWFHETFALILAAASFVTLVVILSRYDGKPTPAWKAGMSINVLVSFLSVIFRIFIMLPVEQSISQATWVALSKEPRPLNEVIYYDSASRGPLGSILFIFRLRLRYFACIGAAIVIIAIGTGPFFQSTLELAPKPVKSPNLVAMATTATTYDGNMGQSGGGEFSTMRHSLPPYLRSSMYSGLVSSPIISLPNPPFSCPTGNCTWDPFATLAVDTQCVDFDSYIGVRCSPNQHDVSSGVTVDDCAFSVLDSNDTYTQSFLEGTSNQTVMKINVGDAMIFRQPTLTKFAPLDIGDKNGGLALVQWIKVKDKLYRPADSSIGTYLQQNTTFEARRCLIYVNVRIISARVDGGSYSETVLDEIVYADNASATVFEEGPGLQFHLNGSAAEHGVRTTLTLPQPGRTMIASEMVNEMFLNKLVNATQGAGTQGPEIARMLYTADNTTQSLEHMAHYLTVALRANDTVLLQEQTGNSSAIAPSQAVDGTVWVQEIFVRVHWEFLSLPALVLALTMVFLIITIVKSHPESVGLWKSNPLTLLLHMENWSAPVDDPITTSDELGKVAAKMQVDIVMKGDYRHVARVVDRVNV